MARREPGAVGIGAGLRARGAAGAARQAAAQQRAEGEGVGGILGRDQRQLHPGAREQRVEVGVGAALDPASDEALKGMYGVALAGELVEPAEEDGGAVATASDATLLEHAAEQQRDAALAGLATLDGAVGGEEQHRPAGAPGVERTALRSVEERAALEPHEAGVG